MNAVPPLCAAYFCSLCRTPFVSESSLDGSGLCTLCRDGARGFDAAYCFGTYDGSLRELIHLFKYARMKALARPLSRMLRTALPRDEQFDVVVPVPMHWRKQLHRGFNQSERLAGLVGRSAQLPLVTKALRRVSGKRTQAGLTYAERQKNVAGAFHVPHPALVEGRRVLLVDDVFTTGATASACAKVLKKAGARSVVLLTLAHVDRRWSVVSASEKLPGASEDGYFDPTAETGTRSECEL